MIKLLSTYVDRFPDLPVQQPSFLITTFFSVLQCKHKINYRLHDHNYINVMHKANMHCSVLLKLDYLTLSNTENKIHNASVVSHISVLPYNDYWTSST